MIQLAVYSIQFKKSCHLHFVATIPMSAVHFVIISSQWLRLVFLFISSSCRCNDSVQNFLLAFRLHSVATAALPANLLEPPACMRKDLAKKCLVPPREVSLLPLQEGGRKLRCFPHSITKNLWPHNLPTVSGLSRKGRRPVATASRP